MSRTQNAVKNTKFGLIAKIIGMLLGFVSRTVFIYYLGNEYLGVNGLFTEILQILSFTELGFGNALILAMYKPVADNDIDKIERLLHFYKTTYRAIAAIITALGLAIFPFLQYIVKGADDISLWNLRIYYLVFLFNTVISYFVTYKFSYVNALQKNYIQTKVDMIINTVTVFMQILIIVVFRNYFVYLITSSLMLVASRAYISFYLNKQFPILKCKTDKRLTKEEKKPIFGEVKGLAFHQFSSVAVHSTDNIIISSLSGAGVVAVGMISNYNLLMTSVLGFVLIIFNSVTSGFGNLVATSSTADYRKVFLVANFINFWIYGFCSIAFFVLIPPFITLWLGESSVIDTLTYLLIIVNCYLQGQSTIYNNARIAKGNFNKDKWMALMQALVNLVISVIGAYYLGLVGVYIGTVVSRLTYIIFRPFSTYKFLFEKSSREYYARLTLYFMITFASGALCWWICQWIMTEISILTFILSAIVVLVIPNVIFFICFFRTTEFKEVLSRGKSYLKRGNKQ